MAFITLQAWRFSFLQLYLLFLKVFISKELAFKKETFYASSKITASDFVGFFELSRTLPFKMSSKLGFELLDPLKGKVLP